MKYWFLYDLTTGHIKESHFILIDEWTNIPSQTGIIGPLALTDILAKDVFENPECYNALTGGLVPLSNIVELKTAKEYATLHPKKTTEQKTIDDLTAAKEQSNLSIIEIWENIIPLLP
jgi:hypothetical protein